MVETNMPNYFNVVFPWAMENGYSHEVKTVMASVANRRKGLHSHPESEKFLARIKIKYLQSNKPEIYDEIKKTCRAYAKPYELRTKKTFNRVKKYRENNDPRYKTIVERSRERSFSLKLKFLALMGAKCEQCGYDAHPCALQFHHKNPSDKWSKTSASGYIEDSERFEKDVNEGKLMLLCANCHFIEHFNKPKMRRGLIDESKNINQKITGL